MEQPMKVHPSRPLADGICFDDCEAFDVDHLNHLAAIGAVYLTEFKANGRRYGGRIIARSQEQAESITFGRGLEENVVGRMVEAGCL
jgi:hypothetical protein